MAANPRSAVAWTPVHEDALKGLMHLGLGKQYALDLLEHVKSTQLSDMMNEALRMHTASKKPTIVAGGPRNAMPIKAPAPGAPPPTPTAAPAPAAPPPTAPPPTPPPRPRPVPPAAQFQRPQPPSPQVQPQQQIAPQQEAEAQAAREAAIKRMSSGWSNLIPQVQKAPIQAAAAQLQPATGKPRIRVRAAGSRIPAAPLGGQAPSPEAPSPTKEAPTPSAAQESPTKLPRIRNEEELAQVSGGTEFVWIPDGHIYRKNK